MKKLSSKKLGLHYYPSNEDFYAAIKHGDTVIPSLIVGTRQMKSIIKWLENIVKYEKQRHKHLR